MKSIVQNLVLGITRFELRHNLFHLADNLHVVCGKREFVEFYLVLEGEVVRIFMVFSLFVIFKYFSRTPSNYNIVGNVLVYKTISTYRDVITYGYFPTYSSISIYNNIISKNRITTFACPNCRVLVNTTIRANDYHFRNYDS